ncbi:hypothetical protein [Enterococcus sp. AZ103]|uniref:hypothetical protein n=1 Tax=Enterococcus sp. AZ103 TaxID=2774628 RepID=UPI003F271ED8
MYFLNWGEDGTCQVFLINDHLNIEIHAEHFLIKEDADNVIDLIGGIAVPVQLVNDRDDAIEFTLNNPYYDVTYTTD